MSGTTLRMGNHPTAGSVEPVLKLREPCGDYDFGPADRLVVDLVTDHGTLKNGLIFVVAQSETVFTLRFTGEDKLFPWWLIGTSGQHYPELGVGAKAYFEQ